MRSILVFAAAAAAASSLLPAQAGTFTTFGTGCAPSGGNTCLSANTAGSFSGNAGASANFALPVNTGNSVRVICGIEFYCARRSGNPVNMNVWIYDEASSGGPPGKILRTSTMPVSTTLQWNRANFSNPLILTPNTRFFLVLDNRVGLRLPIMGSGTPNVHYWNGPPTWRGPFTSVRWNYKVICCGGGQAPTISNTGVPTIARSYSVDLAQAPANARSWFSVGLARANVDLSFLGAGGCSLYTQPAVLLIQNTSANGTLSTPVPVPNNSALVGFTYITQYGVADPNANAAGLLFTAGAENKIGR